MLIALLLCAPVSHASPPLVPAADVADPDLQVYWREGEGGYQKKKEGEELAHGLWWLVEVPKVAGGRSEGKGFWGEAAGSGGEASEAVGRVAGGKTGQTGRPKKLVMPSAAEASRRQ